MMVCFPIIFPNQQASISSPTNRAQKRKSQINLPSAVNNILIQYMLNIPAN